MAGSLTLLLTIVSTSTPSSSGGYLAGLLERWDDENAAEGLLAQTRFAERPVTQTEPSEKSLRAVVDILSKGSSFASLRAAEQSRYLDLTRAIERQVVFVTGTGQTLSEGKRLFISFRIAHALLVEGLAATTDIRAFVAYAGATRVRRDEREAGLVMIELPSQVFRRLVLLERWLGQLESAAQHGAPRELVSVVKEAAKAVRKAIRRCKEDPTFPHAAITPMTTALRALAAGLQSTRGALAESLRNIGGSIDNLSDQIEELARKMAADDVCPWTIRGTSVHVSWTSVVMGDIGGSDVIAHEIAHVLHSRADLAHYLTTGSMVTSSAEAGSAAAGSAAREDHLASSPFARDLDVLHARAVAGELDFLGSYAKTNPAELFAVASEHYLRDAPALRRRSADVYDLLHAFYGPRELVFTQRSSLHLLASFVGPLSVLREA